MSSFLCFICHSTVNDHTNEDMREKYREVVGMNLCPDSHLCHICCHVLNRLWLFKSVCLKRSLEYPVLFSEKGTLNLQRNDLEIHTVCFEDCEHYKNRNVNSKYYHFKHFNDTSDSNEEYPSFPNDYVKFDNNRIEFEDFQDKPNFQNTINVNTETEYDQNFMTEVSNDDESNEYDGDDNFDDKIDQTVGNYEQNQHFDLEVPYNDCIDSYDDQDFKPTTNIEDEIFYKYDEEEIESRNIEEMNKDITELDKSDTKKKEKKKSKSKKEKPPFEKFKLSVKEQKLELERSRKDKKYIEAEFKCYNCALGFLFKDTYQAHMMRHEESNGEYLCGICTLRFATPAVLRAHTSIHAERHKCTKCSEVVRPRHRTNHLRACRDLPVEGVACHLCGKIFNGSAALQQHLKRFHRSKDTGRTYACSVCGERFQDQAAVRTHMIKHIQRKFNCDSCSSSFGSPHTLRQHKKKHELHITVVKPSRPPREMASFECGVCARVCPSVRALSSHAARAHAPSPSPAPAPAAPHACARCPARYTTRKSLLRHMRSHDGQAAPTRMSICHHCGNSFKGNNKLNRHLRQVCEKEKGEDELLSCT